MNCRTLRSIPPSANSHTSRSPGPDKRKSEMAVTFEKALLIEGQHIHKTYCFIAVSLLATERPLAVTVVIAITLAIPATALAAVGPPKATLMRAECFTTLRVIGQNSLRAW